tara:strand:+ start:1305 stop:1526 length:222 start_codon:yes stop_codon:yes gene_type:complete
MKLYDEIIKLPKKNILHLMLESLDHMQSYNGRTQQDCIMLCLEGKLTEGEKGEKRYWTYNPKKMRKLTEHCPL